MALNGIDVASYQTPLNLNNVSYDFVMIKATEGVSYVNPDCDTKYQEAKAAGKLRAVYMFVDHGGDPEAEADYFVDNITGYIGDAILAVDWEGSFVADTDYLHRILIRIHARTGVKPLVYMSEYVENKYDWSAIVDDDYGLWIARYADYEIDHNYDMSGAGQSPTLKHWSFAALWQWTSSGVLNGYAGDLDCDIFYGDTNAWNAYAAAPEPAPVAPAPAAEAPAPTPAPVADPTPVEVTVQPNDHDGAVSVSTPAQPTVADLQAQIAAKDERINSLVGDAKSVATTKAPAAPVEKQSFVSRFVEALLHPKVASAPTTSAAAKGYRTAVQTIVGGVVATVTAIIAVPQVQVILSTSLSKYVAPALLGLGISSGLVSLIMNTLEGLTKPKA